MGSVPDKFVDRIENKTSFSKKLFHIFCLYEILWKNIVESGRPQMTIRRMRIAYWIPKATN
jgi:hypothetical protein